MNEDLMTIDQPPPVKVGAWATPLPSPVYLGREARDAMVGREKLDQMREMETTLGEPGWVQSQLDREASASWLAGRMGRPTEEVKANFAAYAHGYFGRAVTAGQAYDMIVEHETNSLTGGQPASAAGPAKGAKGQDGGPDAEGVESQGIDEPKPWQFLRTAGATFEGQAQNIPGGFYGFVSGALETMGGVPEGVDLSKNETWVRDYFEAGRLEDAGLGDTEEARALRSSVDTEARAADLATKAARDEWQSSTYRGAMAGESRRLADFWYDLSAEAVDRYASDADYRETTAGKFAQVAGSAPVASALIALGGVGGWAKVGAAGRAAYLGAVGTGTFASVEQAQMEAQGDGYRAGGTAWALNVANAGGQALLEKVIPFDDVLAQVIRQAPHVGGKVALGEVLRALPRQMAVAGLGEGGEEVLQGMWDDAIVAAGYDDSRFVLDEEFAKRRVFEFAAGFAGGAVMGGVVQPVAAIDRNRAAARAGELFTAKDGGLLMANDWPLLRRAKSDGEIRSMRHGDVLLRATNGDQAAQAEYNRLVFAEGFVKTDGLSANGVTIGSYKGRPAVTMSDGRTAVFDEGSLEEMRRFNAMRATVARDAGTAATVAEFQKRFGADLQVTRGAAQKLSDLRKAGGITAEQEADALAAAEEINGALSAADGDGLILGSATLTRDDKAGVFRMAVKIADGASPDVVVEELAEAWKQKAIADGKLDPAELTSARAAWHTQHGEADPVADGKVTAERADTEWFSKRVIEYALATKQNEILGNWGRWIRALGTRLRGVIAGAKRMRSLVKAGKLDPRLESWFQAAFTGKPVAEPVDPVRAARLAELEQAFGALPAEEQITVREIVERNDLADFELLKADYRGQEVRDAEETLRASAVGDGDRIVRGRRRAVGKEVRDAVDQAVNLPEGVQLSAQAQAVVDKWESFSLKAIAAVRPASIAGVLAAEPDTRPPEYRAFEEWADDVIAKRLGELGYTEVIRMRNEGYTESLRAAKAKFRPGGMELFNNVTLPTDEVARRLVPGADKALRDRSARAMAAISRDHRTINALAAKMGALPDDVSFVFDRALLNGDAVAVEVIADKFGFTEEYRAVTAVLAEIRRGALEVGVSPSTFWDAPEDFDFTSPAYKAAREAATGEEMEAKLAALGWKLRIASYWPRTVIDHDAYVAWLTETDPEQSALSRAYELALRKAREQGRNLTEAELDALLQAANGAMRGTTGRTGAGGKPGALKQRTVAEIDPAALRFYQKPLDSVYTHTERMHEYIETMRFFGKAAAVKEAAAIGAVNPLDVAQSIGAFVLAEAADKGLTAKQQRAMEELLTSRFAMKGSPYWVSQLKVVGYLSGMTQIYSPLTAALPDFAWSGYEAGSPIRFAESVVKTLTGKSRVTLEDLGISEAQVSEEFRTQTGGRMERFLNVALKRTGLRWLSNTARQTLVNATISRLVSSAKSGKLSATQERRISRFFNDEERAELLADAAAGDMTSELLRFYAFNAVADVNPISRDQMPPAYNASPYGRLFYQYKSFLVLQVAAVRREALEDMFSGDAKRALNGVMTLGYLAGLLIAFSVPSDIIRALITGKSYYLGDEAVNKLLGLVGISHYVAREGREDPVKGFIAFFLPSVGAVATDLYKDTRDLIDFPYASEDMDLMKLRTLNNLPFIGRLWQGWLGSDADRRAEKRAEEGSFGWSESNEDTDEQTTAARERALVKRYAE